jgi:hypothetical protein
VARELVEVAVVAIVEDDEDLIRSLAVLTSAPSSELSPPRSYHVIKREDCATKRGIVSAISRS